jgi:hypothetical protein
METMMFKPVSHKLNVTSMEDAVLKFWKQREIFKKTVAQRQGAPEYVFYARRTPRAGARLQGYVSALQDHARLSRLAPRRLGYTRAAG